jgi:Ras-related protein Rab-15
MSSVNKYSIKIILIGDSNVGKTSLIQRYMRDEFTDYQFQTIGVDFVYHNYVYDDDNYGVYIWDTAGQEKFQSMVSQFYRGSHGAVLCFDICNRETFESVPKWITEIRKSNPDINIILCGTKSDLVEQSHIIGIEDNIPNMTTYISTNLSNNNHHHHTRNNSYYPSTLLNAANNIMKRRQISVDEAVNFAYINNISYIETSSKENINISNTFDTIINDVIKNNKSFNSEYYGGISGGINGSKKEIIKINKKYLNIPKNTVSLINPEYINIDNANNAQDNTHNGNRTILTNISNVKNSIISNVRTYCNII